MIRHPTSTYFKYQRREWGTMAAKRFTPNSQQKTWMLVEAAIKQLSRRSRSRYFSSQEIADTANSIASKDRFYSSVGTISSAKIIARMRTWMETGFVRERSGTFVRTNPWEPAPKGIKTKPLGWRWVGGNRSATIPGHPTLGDAYHRQQKADFKREIRKRLGL